MNIHVSESSISMLNNSHATCSAVNAAVLMILFLLGSLLVGSAITWVSVYLAMELQNLVLLVHSYMY